jgi:hypothetical protein
MTPERDGSTALVPVVALGPVSLAADNAPAAVDLRDFGKATLLLAVGIGGITFDVTNKIEVKLTHSSDDVTYTSVGDDDVIKDAFAPPTITGGIVRSLVAAHAAADVQKLGYIGGKRYVKVLADFSGTHGAGTPIAAVWVKSKGDVQGAA